MGSFYTESSYNFGTNSAQFPADRERHKGEDACGTRERPRAVQGRGRERHKGEAAERYKENKGDGTAGDRKYDSVSPTVPSPHSFTDSLRKVPSEESSSEDSLVCGKFRQI